MNQLEHVSSAQKSYPVLVRSGIGRYRAPSELPSARGKILWPPRWSTRGVCRISQWSMLWLHAHMAVITSPHVECPEFWPTFLIVNSGAVYSFVAVFAGEATFVPLLSRANDFLRHVNAFIASRAFGGPSELRRHFSLRRKIMDNWTINNTEEGIVLQSIKKKTLLESYG